MFSLRLAYLEESCGKTNLREEPADPYSHVLYAWEVNKDSFLAVSTT